ncbi:L,D-transpeptidase [Leifsonia sp. 2TAF2]|uniref:L,D-transpeptidase n=1 Tax=Leifsonia sp. 2TAF2 TaxID=3233009 RepID=UPI003F9A8F6C
MPNRRILPALLASLSAVALVAALSACSTGAPAPTSRASSTDGPTADAGPALPPALPGDDLAALPATTYDAVIPGLLVAPADPRIRAAARVAFDTAAYAADFTTPVARIPATDFLGQPTVIVPVQTRGRWSLVLTPSRQQLPSKSTEAAPAAAQSAAWVLTQSLLPAGPLTKRIVISTSKQTLSILNDKGASLQSFPVGIGTSTTPTPTGTGYLQARYLDPAQGQGEHRIQLTSLHATAADEPYGGSDGGLIGIHFQTTATGAVSHGCVRLSAEAIAAVDALPLGTAVQITG